MSLSHLHLKGRVEQSAVVSKRSRRIQSFPLVVDEENCCIVDHTRDWRYSGCIFFLWPLMGIGFFGWGYTPQCPEYKINCWPVSYCRNPRYANRSYPSYLTYLQCMDGIVPPDCLVCQHISQWSEGLWELDSSFYFNSPYGLAGYFHHLYGVFECVKELPRLQILVQPCSVKILHMWSVHR